MFINMYDKLIDFAQQKNKNVVWVFLCSSVLIFVPKSYLKVLNLNDLHEYIEVIVGFIFLISCILIIINITIWGQSEYADHRDVIKRKKLLLKLRNLSAAKELEGAIESFDTLISWSNRVAPLLEFNEQYYFDFSEAASRMNTKNLSKGLYGSAWNVMKSQLEMAIEKLKNELGE